MVQNRLRQQAGMIEAIQVFTENRQHFRSSAHLLTTRLLAQAVLYQALTAVYNAFT